MLAVVLVEENADIVHRLTTIYPDSHEFSPTVFLVDTSDTSSQIVERIGLEDTKQGVVFKLSGKISGFASEDTYHWLAQHLGQPA